MELRDEFIRPHDRPGHELREETEVEPEIEEIPYRKQCIPAPVHIYDVADGLEGEERYSYRKEDRIHAECVVPCDKVAGDCEIILHLESGPEEVVDHVGQEVCVLVIEQQRQIDRNPQEQHQTLPKPPPAMRQEPACEVVVNDYEAEQDDEQSAGLVIEEQAGEEQEGVPHQGFVLEEAEECHHEGEERPEIELGEQQRMGLVEREQVRKEIQCNFPEITHFPSSPYIRKTCPSGH